MIQALAFLGGSPFAQATIANFLFFFALNTFVFLPLHILQLGGTDAEIGLIQAMYSATTMWALLSGVLAIGFAVSFRLRPGTLPPRRRQHLDRGPGADGPSFREERRG